MRRSLVGFTALILALVGWVSSGVAQNDQSVECDNRFEEEGANCGTENKSGGGAAAASVLVDGTGRGDTIQTADDFDNDGLEDNVDNCPRAQNVGQSDADGDTVGNLCDNCSNVANTSQLDIDGNAVGNVCDDDMDGDEVLNPDDNCLKIPNPVLSETGAQPDFDGDGAGDACDDDIDGDGVGNLDDPCPASAEITNPSNTNPGSECFPDKDGDKVPDASDSCVRVFNPKQKNMDGNELGNRCDPDMDGDDVQNVADNCEQAPNAAQVNGDRDDLGDACDPKFCYVVAGDKENCLNPNDPLDVYSPEAVGETGKAVDLRLFANRRNQALEYTWTMKSKPENARPIFKERSGKVSDSTPFEYQYLKDDAPVFIPDKPGTYRFQVSIEPVFEDRVSGRTDARATHTVPIRVQGEPTTVRESAGNSGCGATVASTSRPLSTGLWLAVLGLFGLIVRRRRT